MDSDRQQLAAVNLEINNLVKKRSRLRKKELNETITDDEEIDLAGFDELLQKLEKQQEDYLELIKLSRNEPPESKSFSEANRAWIESVTGINTNYRKWTGYVIDESIYPDPEFKTAFERVGKSFHQLNEPGRRIFLNLFLSNIILRPEFNESLRIFPELEMSVVETNGPKKRKLNGRTDYTVGFGKGKDMFDNSIPQDVHMVAVEAKTSIGEKDLWQCVAEAASLYKTRVDAGKKKKNVWGILSNAETWRFIFIDEDGLLWQSGTLNIDLRCYTEIEVLQVYRILYYIVNCCYEACTPPGSTAASDPSSSQ